MELACRAAGQALPRQSTSGPREEAALLRDTWGASERFHANLCFPRDKRRQTARAMALSDVRSNGYASLFPSCLVFTSPALSPHWCQYFCGATTLRPPSDDLTQRSLGLKGLRFVNCSDTQVFEYALRRSIFGS